MINLLYPGKWTILSQFDITHQIFKILIFSKKITSMLDFLALSFMTDEEY